ncbi:MAG: histidine kinase [Deltaproteobacteria bacterium]|nr:MAG: histidine kinase [Deltaproteobacteria bacterium]
MTGDENDLSKLSLEELRKRLDDLMGRWPQHSVPPSLWQEREELEEEIARREKSEGKGSKDS